MVNSVIRIISSSQTACLIVSNENLTQKLVIMKKNVLFVSNLHINLFIITKTFNP